MLFFNKIKQLYQRDANLESNIKPQVDVG
jgi:hypothetical protein